ncbi:MAG: hypothetical protein K2X27_12130 [Candidatus Obscuribacterales bacterium]|nr:hypothetical protein [Candidatus Obscuribacterales bacterium]
MAFPEVERDDAPRNPHAPEEKSKSEEDSHKPLPFRDELPNLNRLFSKKTNQDTVLERSSEQVANGLLDEYLQKGPHKHKSPWAKNSEKTKEGEASIDKPLEAAPAPKLVDDKVEAKKPEEKNKPEEASKPAAAESPKAEPAKLNLDGILPSLSLDTSKIQEKLGEAIDSLQGWYEKLSELAALEAQSKKTPEERLAKEEEKPEATAAAIADVPQDGGKWRKEGDSWSFLDNTGKKQNKYEAKVSEVSKDSEGNTVLKFSDGRSIKEKTDGSKLEYDAENKLKSISYKDGSSREFKWDGDELVYMKSKTGEFKRAEEAPGKYKNEWTKTGDAAPWQGELKVDQKTGLFSVGSQMSYGSDLSVEKKNADGSKEVSYSVSDGKKDIVKISKDGTISEISYADGSNRKFTWEQNPNAKGEVDKFRLSAIQVYRDGKNYFHTKQSDGSWKISSYEGNAWSAPVAEKTTFDLNNKTAEYSFSEDNVKTIRKPGGIEKAIGADGSSLEYKDGKLSKVIKDDKVREFEWKGNELLSVKDGIQGKTWKASADGGWESDQGDKRKGSAYASPSGELGFKDGNKESIIKVDGAEYQRINNEKEKSRVDIREGQVDVSAADNSARSFKTGKDGNEVLQESLTRNGKTESWSRGEKLPNGNYEWINDQDKSKKEERLSVEQKDGNLKIQYPDGRKYEAYTSGAENLENKEQKWSVDYKNGQPAETKFADGTIRRFTFDSEGSSPKSVQVVSPDGQVTDISRISDGVYNYKNKSTDMKWNVRFEVPRDGSYKYTDSDEKGKTVTRMPDGKQIIETPSDKTRIEKQLNDIVKVERDGKTVEIIRDKDKKVTEFRDYASNSSYKKDEKNNFVAEAIDTTKPFSKLDNLQRSGALVLDESGTANFIDNEGKQIRQLPGQKGELVSSKEMALEAVNKNSSMSDTEKADWQKTITEYSKRSDVASKEKAVFHESIAKFAARTDISEKEKAKTYEQIARLLESKSDTAFNTKERALLAAQLAWHVGNPAANAQGENPNCQVTTVRGKLLYDSPSQFARMMTDVITSGKFTTQDKSVIKPPSSSFKISEGSPESVFPPEDGTRTWLGKISDVTCANIHWQRQTRTPQGEIVQAGHLVYRQDLPGSRKDTGSKIWKEPGDGYIYPVSNTDGKSIENPSLYAKDIADVYKQITGNSKDNVVIAVERSDIKSGPGVGLFTEQSLHEYLSKNKGQTHIAQIYTAQDWVWREPARKYGIKPKDENDGEHVVLVKDYDPVTKTVAIDNSWSAKYDRLGDRRISLNELYKAMAKQ